MMGGWKLECRMNGVMGLMMKFPNAWRAQSGYCRKKTWLASFFVDLLISLYILEEQQMMLQDFFDGENEEKSLKRMIMMSETDQN